MRLERLVYISTSTHPVGAGDDVPVILAQAVRHNPANNITGALAFTTTRFVQLIEGSVSSIDVLLLKLMIDPRHRDMNVVDRVPIAARAFGRWSMIAPPMTPEAQNRLEILVDREMRPLGDFQQILLDMVSAGEC